MSKAMEGDVLRRPKTGIAGLWADIRFAQAYVRHNLAGALEYRVSFVSQMIGMIVNDAFWVAFWCLYFHRFPLIHGWTLRDILTVWSIAAVGFGLSAGIFGNSNSIGGMIARGDLDYYLALPRNVLLHTLVSRTNASAWGDVLFGLAVYASFVHPNLPHFALFLVLSVMVGVVIVSFDVLTESLAFFIGGAEGLAGQLRIGLISFATYPITLFDGFVKVLLYTVIPAAFVSYIPVLLLRHLEVHNVLLMAGYTVGIAVVSSVVFFAGLRRYESGNLVGLRG